MKRNLPVKIRLEVLFLQLLLQWFLLAVTFSGAVILYVLLYTTVAVSGRTSNNALMLLRALCTALCWNIHYEIEQNNGNTFPVFS